MGRRVVTSVRVRNEEGATVVLSPGDEVPAWAESQVTNPAVYGEDTSEPSPYATVEAASAIEGEGGQSYTELAAEEGFVDSADSPDYSSMKVAELRDLIAARNAGRPETSVIPDDGTKAELVSALEADDQS